MKRVKQLWTLGVTSAMLAASSVVHAQSQFNNVTPNTNATLGKVSKNTASSLVDATSALEAVLYVGAVFFIVMFIFSLVKWKKSDGREGNPGLIAIYLVAGVLCIAAPTLMGGGLATLFGGGTVQTIKPPTTVAP